MSSKREYDIKYRAENRKLLREKALRYYHKYREENREELASKSRTWYSNNKEKRAATQAKIKLNPASRLNSILHGCKRRATTKGIVYELDREWVNALWKDSGCCCMVTGIPFDLNPTDYGKNPYAPSLDRKDPSIGYTKDNTQLVVYMYNTAKGDWGHNNVLVLAEALLNVSTKR